MHDKEARVFLHPLTVLALIQDQCVIVLMQCWCIMVLTSFQFWLSLDYLESIFLLSVFLISILFLISNSSQCTQVKWWTNLRFPKKYPSVTSPPSTLWKNILLIISGNFWHSCILSFLVVICCSNAHICNIKKTEIMVTCKTLLLSSMYSSYCSCYARLYLKQNWLIDWLICLYWQASP